MSRFKWTALGLVLCGAIALPLAASAGDNHRGTVKAACAADVETLCGSVENGKEARACLKTHRESLSDACTEALQKARRGKRKGAVAQACSQDRERFCEGLTGKSLRVCMRSHREELSPQCSDAIKKVRRHRRANKAPAE